MKRRGRILGPASLLLLLASGSVAAEAPPWRIERGDVSILVPLRPGGAFTATTPSLSGTLTLDPAKPARLTGEISIDLATIDTGINLRNQHLRENYLEVAKGKGYDKAVLSEIQLKDAERRGFRGSHRVHGHASAPWRDPSGRGNRGHPPQRLGSTRAGGVSVDSHRLRDNDPPVPRRRSREPAAGEGAVQRDPALEPAK